jgi:uncharacterized membrane protein (UPF0127 family)
VYASLALALLLATCACRSAPLCPEHRRALIGGRAFTLEVARDERTRHQGLSDRAEVVADGGMLFIYPRPRPLQFVMRRCLVPLDLLLVDETGRVVAVHEMRVEPPGTPEAALPRYGHPLPVPYAIELRGGTARALGLQPGATVAFLE